MIRPTPGKKCEGEKFFCFLFLGHFQKSVTKSMFRSIMVSQSPQLGLISDQNGRKKIPYILSDIPPKTLIWSDVLPPGSSQQRCNQTQQQTYQVTCGHHIYSDFLLKIVITGPIFFFFTNNWYDKSLISELFGLKFLFGDTASCYQ